MNTNKNTTQDLLDVESLRIDDCEVIKPAGVGAGKKRQWVVQCHCGGYFLMSQRALGNSRSATRRWDSYHCGCQNKTKH